MKNQYELYALFFEYFVADTYSLQSGSKGFHETVIHAMFAGWVIISLMLFVDVLKQTSGRLLRVVSSNINIFCNM